MNRLIRSVCGTVLAIGLTGCGGDSPTDSQSDPIDPALLEAMAVEASRGIGIDPGDFTEAFQGGTTGFGSGASTSGEFGSGEATSEGFEAGADTGADFGSGAGTSTSLGGGGSFAFNFTNRLMLRPAIDLESGVFLGGLSVFEPGSSNQITWAPTAASGSYTFVYSSVEFDRFGFVGEFDQGQMTLSGLSYTYRAPRTSRLAVIVFVVVPEEGGLGEEFGLQWGIALVGNPGDLR